MPGRKWILWVSICLEFIASSSGRTQAVARTSKLGPRPFYLVDKMDPSRLKRALPEVHGTPFFYQTDFSIGYRGGRTL